MQSVRVPPARFSGASLRRRVVGLAVSPDSVNFAARVMWVVMRCGGSPCSSCRRCIWFVVESTLFDGAVGSNHAGVERCVGCGIGRGGLFFRLGRRSMNRGSVGLNLVRRTDSEFWEFLDLGVVGLRCFFECGMGASISRGGRAAVGAKIFRGDGVAAGFRIVLSSNRYT